MHALSGPKLKTRCPGQICSFCKLPFTRLKNHQASSIHNHIARLLSNNSNQECQSHQYSHNLVVENTDLKNEIDKLKAENQKIMDELKISNSLINSAFDILSQNKNKVDFDSKLKRVTGKYYTEYQREYKFFSEYCFKNSLSKNEISAAEYLKSLTESKISVINRKRILLQKCLRIVDPLVKIRKVRGNFKLKKPKYIIKQQEAKEYFNEISKKGLTPIVFLQKLLYHTGRRIHALMNLKYEHLEFLKGGNNIVIPDTKTGHEKCTLSNETIKEFKIFLRKIKYDKKSNSKIFNIPNVNRRISRLLRKSKHLTGKSTKFAFGPHCFRTSYYNRRLKIHLNKAKKRTGKDMGHKQTKTGESYVDKNVEDEFILNNSFK